MRFSAIDAKLTSRSTRSSPSRIPAAGIGLRGLWYLVGNTSTGKDLKIRG